MEKPKSSKKTKSQVTHKVFADQEDRPGRYLAWPRDLFIELTLSPKQVRKVRYWVKKKHSIIPMWAANSKCVLFVDQDRLDEWFLKKARK